MNNSQDSGFTYRNGDQEFTAPPPSQSAWDTILAVLAGAAIAIVAGMAQADCRRDD